MVTASPRSRFSDPALVRLLARVAEVETPGPAQPFAARLSQWFHWTDAMALYEVLDSPPPVLAQPVPARPEQESRERDRVHAQIAQAIAADFSPAAQGLGDDFAAHSRRYQARQLAMAAAIAPLRARLRARLAAVSPAAAQLAALDAAMERLLAGQERTLLSTVPDFLEQHHRRLQAEHQAAPAPTTATVTVTPTAPTGATAALAKGPGPATATAAPTTGTAPGTTPTSAWLQLFRQEVQSVLLAELALRLQPVDGLLAALHAPPSEPA